MPEKIMTGAEVLERTQEISAELGRTYGQLQDALLTPLVKKTVGLMEDKRLIDD